MHWIRAALEPVGKADLDVQQASIASIPTRIAQATIPTRPSPYPRTDGSPGRGSAFSGFTPEEGLGEVFVAKDEELDREVALKEIQASSMPTTPRAASRFLLEAEITGGLEHPGIVPVYGLGIYDDGRPFYAMRFIKGDSLKEAIDRFHGDRVAGRGCRASGRWSFRSCCAGFWTSATRSPTPTAGACCTATSSRATSWSASTARPWSWTGAWPRSSATRKTSAEATLAAAVGQRLERDAAGLGDRHAAFMSPEQAAGRSGPARPGQRRLQPGRHALLPADRPASRSRSGTSRPSLEKVRQGEFAPPRQSSPDVPRGLEAICLKAMALSPRTAMPPRAPWPTTWSAGWPTSRSRPGASRFPSARGGGCGGTGRW